MDKLTALRVFCRVAELGSFAAAARDLDLSNAAVSKNVRELEQALAVRLINRTTRRLHLTETGDAYFKSVRAVLSTLADADTAVAETARAPRGRLRVAAPMSVGLTRIAPSVVEFLRAYPEMQVDLELDDRYVDVVDGGFDVVIRGAAALHDSTLIVRRLAELERVVCAAPGYFALHGMPDHPKSLRNHACLVYNLSPSPNLWTFHRQDEVCKAEVGGPLRVNNSLALTQAAAAGLGIARIPRFAAEAQLDTGALVAALIDWRVEPTVLHAISPRHRQASLNLRLFVDHLALALK
jgi:DNA-binding transcriptional LysR family regulator